MIKTENAFVLFDVIITFNSNPFNEQAIENSTRERERYYFCEADLKAVPFTYRTIIVCLEKTTLTKLVFTRLI